MKNEPAVHLGFFRMSEFDEKGRQGSAKATLLFGIDLRPSNLSFKR